MRVLQINATYGIGSTGRNVFETDCYLRKQGHQSYAAWGISTTTKTDARIFRVGSVFDHKVHALLMRLTGKQGYYSKRATKKLCKQIEKIAPDIIHLHNLHSNYVCLPLLLDFLAEKDYPVVITLHDCWFFTARCYYYTQYGCNKWQKDCSACPAHACFEKKDQETAMLRLKETKLQKLSRLGIIGVSDWIADEARTSILKNSFRIQRIYNWIDGDIFQPVEVEHLKQELNIAQRKVVLGVSQAWSGSRKGLGEMISIAEKWKDDVLVILIGGIDKNQKLPENVLAVGYVKDVKDLVQYYSLADVFANPSRMETFGKVTAEAMACGTPVVVYGNTGCKELVKEGCGMIAEDGNEEDFIKSVQQVLEKGKGFFSDNCIAYAKEEFDMQKQLQKHCDFYEELLRER